MLARPNVFLHEIKNVADEILKRNFIPSLSSKKEVGCDICGQSTNTIYEYSDGYNHLRWICGCCALINVPFLGNGFRINNLNAGMLVLNPSKHRVTIITNSANTLNAKSKKLVDLDWFEYKTTANEGLLKAITSMGLENKRYVIKLSKRMHNYMHLARASYGDCIQIASEKKGIYLSLRNIEADLNKEIGLLQKKEVVENATHKCCADNSIVNNDYSAKKKRA